MQVCDRRGSILRWDERTLACSLIVDMEAKFGSIRRSVYCSGVSKRI
jgi:hypothetical protein